MIYLIVKLFVCSKDPLLPYISFFSFFILNLQNVSIPSFYRILTLGLFGLEFQTAHTLQTFIYFFIDQNSSDGNLS